MPVNTLDRFNRIQEESLKTIKQTQDATLAAFNEFRALTREAADQPGPLPAMEKLPSPSQLIEMSFRFAAQVFELNRAYALRAAEMLVETQRDSEAAMREAAHSASQGASSTQGSTAAPTASTQGTTAANSRATSK